MELKTTNEIYINEERAELRRRRPIINMYACKLWANWIWIWYPNGVFVCGYVNAAE